MATRFPELGYYTLPGRVADPRPMFRELAAGAAGVVLHASSPDQMAKLLDADAAVRPAARFAGRSPVPGRS